mgnify:FL=1|jgi:uncharacterized protein YlaI|tara:strand:- start:258 stop:527 length:270 start_codon:yes stop_codon:yes gene_type:complete
MPTIRKVYLYEETHLPQKGWMQGCMVCGIITSRLLLFDTKYDTKNKKKYEIYTYICPKCQKKLDDKEILNNYNNASRKMLEENSDLLTG